MDITADSKPIVDYIALAFRKIKPPVDRVNDTLLWKKAVSATARALFESIPGFTVDDVIQFYNHCHASPMDYMHTSSGVLAGTEELHP